MSIATRSDMRHGPDGDDGLDHLHHWARERGGTRPRGPTVADAAAVPMPSSALHDDALYGID